MYGVDVELIPWLMIVTSAQILCFAPNFSVQFDLFIIAIITGVIQYIMK